MSNEVEIIVNGINENDISYWNEQDSKTCHCTPVFLTKSVTITFNIGSEWINLDLCLPDICIGTIYLITGELSSNDDKLIINNWVIDDYTSTEMFKLFIQLRVGTIILNNCIFQNLFIATSIWSFDVSNIEIYNSIFNDIHVDEDWFTSGAFMIGFIYVSDGYFIFENNNVTNIHLYWTHFIFGGSTTKNINKVINCTFDGSMFEPKYSQTYSIIYIQDVSTNNNDPVLIVANSSFNNAFSGGILNIGLGTDGNIIFENNSITTPHLWSSDLADNDVALIMVTETAKLDIYNVILRYTWMDNINLKCNRSNTEITMDNTTYINLGCEMPFRFIRSAGLVFMDHVFISNDLTQDGLYAFRDTFDNALIGIHFESDSYSYANAILYNDRGQLIMNNVDFYGVALHKTILHNTGIAFISNLNISHPDYYYDNNDGINVKTLFEVIYNIGVYSGSDDDQCRLINSGLNDEKECYFDHIDLSLTNGVLIIDNSNMNGGQIAIYDQRGYIEMYNNKISDALIAIYADNSASIKIEFCEFDNIGYFHTADFISLYYIFEMLWYNDHSLYIWNVENVFISDNIFNFFPLTDYLYVWNGNPSLNTRSFVDHNIFSNPIAMENFNTDHFEKFALIAMEHHPAWIEQLNATKYHLVNFKGYTQMNQFMNNVLSF